MNWKNIMVKPIFTTEEKALQQDVKTMSYEELMESIRFLDEERKKLTDNDNMRHNTIIKENKKVA